VSCKFTRYLAVKNLGLFIKQHFCSVLFSGLPASCSCSMLSQHTALTCPTLQHTEDAGSPILAPHKETTCCRSLCCVLETILPLVASLWKAHFSLLSHKIPDATLRAKPVAQPHVAMLESQPTLSSASVRHTLAQNTPFFYAVTSQAAK